MTGKSISIVTAYYNRRSQFIETLKSIQASKHDNYEVIAIDDKSDQRIDDLPDRFPFLRIIRIEKKTHVNSCVPFNIGFKEAAGNIIIIQNPECLHVDDVISYMAENVDYANYVTAQVYATAKDMHTTDIASLPQRSADGVGPPAWYNHPIYRPCHYHFCSGITKTNLRRLGGFDLRYADGIAYDDNELLERINRFGLSLKIAPINVIHQWHEPFYYHHDNFKQLHNRNRVLFEQTKREVIINPNKA